MLLSYHCQNWPHIPVTPEPNLHFLNHWTILKTYHLNNTYALLDSSTSSPESSSPDTNLSSPLLVLTAVTFCFFPSASESSGVGTPVLWLSSKESKQEKIYNHPTITYHKSTYKSASELPCAIFLNCLVLSLRHILENMHIS